MSPEEQQLISGLFDRMRPAANQQRDRDAERLIAEQVRTQPYAPYLLAQTVIVQDQALRAANEKIQQLEEQARQHQPGAPETGNPGFLGGLGRSIFGSGQPDQGRQTVPQTGGRGLAPSQPDPGPYQAQGGGPWGQQQAAPMGGGMGGMFGGGAGGGGGFMKGALGAAAGVAGGVLLADGIRGLFSGGNNPYGIASGFGGGAANPPGETIVNNYYDNPNPREDNADFADQSGGDQGGDNFDPGSYGGGYSNDV